MEHSYVFKESDWKLFSKLLPEWQEAHMQRLVAEYAEIISGPGLASDKFWNLDKRMTRDKKVVGLVARMSRSMMTINILNLINEGVITLDNLADFSEELKDHLVFCLKTRDL